MDWLLSDDDRSSAAYKTPPLTLTVDRFKVATDADIPPNCPPDRPREFPMKKNRELLESETFNAKGSTCNAKRATLNAQRTTFNVQRSKCNFQSAMFSAKCSTAGEKNVVGIGQLNGWVRKRCYDLRAQPCRVETVGEMRVCNKLGLKRINRQVRSAGERLRRAENGGNDAVQTARAVLFSPTGIDRL